MTRASISSRICLLIALVVGTQSLAQSGSTQSSGSPPTPNLASTQAATAPASGTYSIEAEIFAYKSLAANSAQIATDAATRLPALTTEMPTRGVVIVPSVSTILPAFQVWRSNMLVIQNVLNQAANLPSSAAFGCPTQLHSALAPSFVTSATAVSQTVGVIQSIISLFANNQSITEYPGTIQDQALITAVARQLRAKNTEVLAPDLFAPWNIDAAYPSNSPFVTNLAALIDRLMHLQDLY